MDGFITMDRFEEVLKALDAAARTAEAAALAGVDLEDKQRFRSLHGVISEARRKIRLQYWEMDDAIKAAHATIPETACTCPIVDIGCGLRLPVMMDPNCKASTHPNY